MEVGEHGKRPSGWEIEVDQHHVAGGGRYRREHLVTIPCLAHDEVLFGEQHISHARAKDRNRIGDENAGARHLTRSCSVRGLDERL